VWNEGRERIAQYDSQTSDMLQPDEGAGQGIVQRASKRQKGRLVVARCVSRSTSITPSTLPVSRKVLVRWASP
jgi:hypothetical protein